MFAVNIENLKNLKYIFKKKTFKDLSYIFLFFTVSVVMNIKKYLRKTINWNIKNS